MCLRIFQSKTVEKLDLVMEDIYLLQLKTIVFKFITVTLVSNLSIFSVKLILRKLEALNLQTMIWDS